MAEPAATFTDGPAYDRAMSAWSRGAGKVFLEWLGVAPGGRWLDVGCGTGVFTELLHDRCAPAARVAVDPSPEQIGYARTKPIAREVEFRIADAQALPFPDGGFDVVASALVINFIPDRSLAVAEMRRVARSGGIIAGYVWEFASLLHPPGPLIRNLRRLGFDPPTAPSADSTIDGLSQLFAKVGLESVATRAIDVTVAYADFDELWTSLTPGYTASGKFVAAMTSADRDRLKVGVRSEMTVQPDGRLSFSSRANAVKARVP